MQVDLEDGVEELMLSIMDAVGDRRNGKAFMQCGLLMAVYAAKVMRKSKIDVQKEFVRLYDTTPDADEEDKAPSA